MNPSDEHFFSLFERFELAQPSIQSKVCSHKLERMCIFRQCQQLSLHCENKTCEASYQKHKLCKSIHLQGITDLLNHILSSNKSFMIKLFQIEKGFIKDLQSRREEFIKKVTFNNLGKRQDKIFEDIYRKGTAEQLKGKNADYFFQRLFSASKVSKGNGEKSLQNFAAAAKKAFNQLNAFREAAVNEYLSQNKLSQSQTDFNSEILKKSDPKFHEYYSFISDSLEKPKALQLLFRASQHQFSSAKFHLYCDKIPQTFTLIRTEFGKTIAGYNHLTWNGSAIGEELADNERKCFLLSLNLKQKMTLIRPQCAVYNYIGFGPSFGSNQDIFIPNHSNVEYGGANFPYAYNFQPKPYPMCQQTFTAFSGTTIQHNFRVLQYQVFRVIR